MSSKHLLHYRTDTDELEQSCSIRPVDNHVVECTLHIQPTTWVLFSVYFTHTTNYLGTVFQSLLLPKWNNISTS